MTAFELQISGAVLAFTGLLIGVVIEEKQRVSAELRQTLRLPAAGEMAGALSGEKAGRMFDAFQSSKSSGLGLGLAISRAIVEAHGGHLLAEMTDHGLFKLTLPLAEKDDDAARHPVR